MGAGRIVLHPVLNDEFMIAYRRLTGGQCWGGNIERPANAIEHINDMLRPIAPAHAQSAQPVHFGQGAQHDHIVIRLHKPGATIPTFHIIGIGPIEHDHDSLRRFRNQLRKICIQNFCPRRIAGIGNKDHAGARGDGVQNRLHVHMPLGLWYADNARARGHGIKAVHQKPMLCMNDLHLRACIGLA